MRLFKKKTAATPVALPGLDDADAAALTAAASKVRHGAGSVVVREGTPGVGLHLIVEGTALVTVQGESVNRLGPGDFFGEMSLLDGQPRSATITAESDLHTLSVPSWDFKRLLDERPGLSRALAAGLARRLRGRQEFGEGAGAP